MNIKQALKRKNKVIALMNEEFNKALRYNVIEEGNDRPYSSTAALNRWLALSDELVVLKAKIHKANLPVYDLIFGLAELKNQAKLLKALDCTSGKISNRSWGSDNEATVKHAEINVIVRDVMVKQIEEKIEEAQDRLDEWNHKTHIEE